MKFSTVYFQTGKLGYMQYHIQTLVKHLFDKDSFEQVSADELKQFTEDYPYAAVGQFLYAKKLKESGAHNNNAQSEQASLYFHNSLWLRWQLDQKEEAPVIPVKAEEQAQQPGFRIVVQMPKNGPAVYNPATGQEEPKEEEPAMQAAAEPVAETPAENIETAAEAEAPVQAEPAATEKERSLQVNEDGSLVEQEAREQAAATTEQTPEVESAPDSPAAAEAAQNAVNTEEALTPVAGITDNKEADDIVPAVEVVEGEADVDDVIAAVEVTPELADANAVPTEIDDIVPAIEIEEADTDDIVPAIDAELIPPVEGAPVQEAPAETAPAAEIAAAAETVPPGTAIEEQVEPIAEPIPAEAPVALVAEPPQPVASVPEEPEAEEPAPQANPFGFTPAGQDLKISVDPGEPIFESYHTIDYFASQGIKLGQADFKDKMGKQLKSFTDWLRSMKRIGGPIETNTSLDEVTNQSIQRIAEHSVEEKEVLTEAMAEVWAKQGNAGKAIRVYEKLSLLNPAKSTYFATRIEQLKAQ
ncbi:hypothetical protein [Niastella populi]|uniref:Uncharacterized protein n=1 Tax=Niastella populi TaxID=550983 RepID=A0A1V9G4P3_9BACT|nr:hypothetical protein [Niastella populi]OQP65615.1 hypothetical protein A4R26_14390 [Niastella populi]